MKGEFMWDMGGALDTMRLIAEGAVVLFEEDTSPITKLARDNGELIAGTAFNTIGEALYSLRTLIRELQEAHGREVDRQLKADELGEAKTDACLDSRKG